MCGRIVFRRKAAAAKSFPFLTLEEVVLPLPEWCQIDQGSDRGLRTLHRATITLPTLAMAQLKGHKDCDMSRTSKTCHVCTATRRTALRQRFDRLQKRRKEEEGGSMPPRSGKALKLSPRPASNLSLEMVTKSLFDSQLCCSTEEIVNALLQSSSRFSPNQ